MATDRVQGETDDSGEALVGASDDPDQPALFTEVAEPYAEPVGDDTVEHPYRHVIDHSRGDDTTEHPGDVESGRSLTNPLVDDAAPEDTVTLGDAPAAAERPPTVADVEEAVLEMRQVAGLTAGSMMKLTAGRAFEFNESNEGGSFSIRVLENGEVVVHPGTAKAVIDEVEVTEPTLIGDAILNVSSACFSVRPPRRAASNETRMEAVNAAFASAFAIAVPALDAEDPLPPDQLAGSRLGSLINRNPLTRGAVGQAAWEFLQSIRETRSVVAERHRLLHPDPEELKTRLSRLDPGLWERGREHPLFGRFSVAYATIPWEPRFDNPELIPEILHEPIVEMSLLPWVPVTANLFYGPFAIVGRRAARLAACRHAILSLACLSVPGEVRFSIQADRTKAASWNWCRALPPMMADDDRDGYRVTVVDGMENLDRSESDLSPASSLEALLDFDVTMEEVDTRHSESAMILLADSIEDVDHPCGTILQIHADGTASITNHLNETIQVTPIGATEAFAHDMATRVSDILTNSFL